jgi:hypothetical protein
LQNPILAHVKSQRSINRFRILHGPNSESSAFFIDGKIIVERRVFSFGTTSPLKKSLRAAEQARPDVARARRRWIREQGMLNPARLVFIDETTASTKMVRLNGRCPRGVRLIGHAPHGHWKTITFVAGLRNDGMVAPFVFDGPMNGPTFVTYIQQCLAPTLARRV